MQAGLITAAHDCSDGGLAVAVAEMAVAARLGVSVIVPIDGLDPFTALVNEAPGRLVLASAPADRDAVEAVLGEHGRRIGEVTADERVVFRVPDNTRGEGIEQLGLEVIDLALADVVTANTQGIQ